MDEFVRRVGTEALRWIDSLVRIVTGGRTDGILQESYRGGRESTTLSFSLDTPLLTFPSSDHWHIRDACEGTQVFGMTGSGKTSGSGQAIAKSFLTAGFGGVVLTAKNDEREMWEEWCEATGRTDDLMIVSPGTGLTFNFLDYEVRRPGAGAGLTHNLVHLFETVSEVGARQGGGGGGEDSGYWKKALSQLLRNTIDLVVMATDGLSLDLMYSVVLDAPKSPAMARDSSWQKSSKCMKTIVQAKSRKLDSDRTSDLDMTCRYWLREFPGLAEKTRSIIVNMFTGMAESFLRSPFREMFCNKTTVIPEHTFQGKIIVLDLPVKEYDALGKYAQVLFKYIWQRAVERRNVKKDPRPVFLWADEAQFFVSSTDTKFQSTARSKRACTVYLTQNLPSYLDELGGDRAKQAVLSLLGNLGTKVFHANSDTETNQYAAEIIGRSLQQRMSGNLGMGVGGLPSQSAGFGEVIDYDLQPQAFTMLRKGGPDNDLCVDGIVYQGGRVWNSTGKTYLPVVFKQG